MISMEDIYGNALNHEEYQDPNTSASSPESSPSAMKLASTSSLKRSKRGVQKKVISVPIKDAEGSQKTKGENAAPPSDSWAWRKYGQKPIKGSPYPRGYYRCSSYKGCPARKQVERSKMDPTMLMITYSYEHNHPWPLPMRNQHHHTSKSSTSKRDEEPPPTSEEKLDRDLTLEATGEDDFCWFSGMGTAESSVLESPVFAESARSGTAAELSVIFPLREEDESLFADLGELPECSAVFRPHRGADPQLQIC